MEKKLKFSTGDKITWNVRGGASRRGEIWEVVPSNRYSKTLGRFHKSKQMTRRDHESYVVRDQGGEFFYPKVGCIWPVAHGTTLRHASAQESAAAAKASTQSTKPSTKPSTKTDFIICLDTSGSMQTIRRGAIDMFNAELEAIRRSGLDAAVSVYYVGYPNDQVHCHHYRTSISAIEALTESSYRPNGGTPLLDGMGKAITELRPVVQNLHDRAFVLHVITDGEELHSKTWNVNSLRAALGEIHGTGRWTTAVMLPRGMRDRFLRDFPIVSADNILEWETTDAGIRAASVATVAAVSNYATARSRGATSVANFYVQPDLSKLSASDLAKLNDLSPAFKTYTVGQEIAIKDFIEGKTGRYVLGSAYYQLTKTEKKVHAQKNVLLRDRFTGRIYGGADARRLIGLPFGQDAKVEPGNHAQFDIFIESTSPNRLLVRGSTVLHDFNRALDSVPTWDFAKYATANGVSGSQQTQP